METVEKKRKKVPQTINDRIISLSRKYSIPELSQEQKKEIGILTSQKFYIVTGKWEGHKPYLMTKNIQENGQEITVRLYPSFFVPVLDAMIFEYLKEKGIYEKI